MARPTRHAKDLDGYAICSTTVQRMIVADWTTVTCLTCELEIQEWSMHMMNADPHRARKRMIRQLSIMRIAKTQWRKS